MRKVRKDLGLTGRGTAEGRSRARVGAGRRSSAGVQSGARGIGPVGGDRTPAAEDRRPDTEGLERPAESEAAGGDRARVRIGLEGAIDELLHEIKLTGGLPAFEAALRRARRILARSHGE